MLHEIQLVSGQMVDNIAMSGATFTNARPVSADTLRCRKPRVQEFRPSPYSGPQAASIARRNARERNRVRQVNDGFSALRKHLPASAVAALAGGRRAGRKLSKVDTLRLVVEYIRYLQRLLEDDENMPTDSDGRILSPAFEPSRYCTSVSPAPSESSSGVSSGYSLSCGPDAESYGPLGPMDEDELLDVIACWQHK